MTTSTAASLASIPLDRLLSDLETSRAGLTEAEALARLKRHGPNDALAREGRSLAIQFLLRFFNPLVLILLFASALSALAGDTANARKAFQDLFELWKDADPDLTILQQAKAEYAKLR